MTILLLFFLKFSLYTDNLGTLFAYVPNTYVFLRTTFPLYFQFYRAETSRMRALPLKFHLHLFPVDADCMPCLTIELYSASTGKYNGPCATTLERETQPTIKQTKQLNYLIKDRKFT